eukprot:2517295-Amphidinium_carterae.2
MRKSKHFEGNLGRLACHHPGEPRSDSAAPGSSKSRDDEAFKGKGSSYDMLQIFLDQWTTLCLEVDSTQSLWDQSRAKFLQWPAIAVSPPYLCLKGPRLPSTPAIL